MNANAITAYKYADRTDPYALIPRLYRPGNFWLRLPHQLAMRSQRFRTFRIAAHSDGLVFASPFVSLVLDPEMARRTHDEWLLAIIESAPDIGVFRIPVARLIYPPTAMAQRETEVLFEGRGLVKYLVRWDVNPYRQG